MGITHLIGREVSFEAASKLTPDEREQLVEANYALRRFGWGPYVATMSDDSGHTFALPYKGYSERAVEGVCFILIHILAIARTHPRKYESLQDVFSDVRVGAKAQQELLGLKNYRVHPAELGKLDGVLSIDPRTVKVTIKNNRGQLIYTSRA